MKQPKPPKITANLDSQSVGGSSKLDLSSLLLGDTSPIDTVTLSSLGTYMFFEEVDADSIKPACEFIIKANFVFEPDMTLSFIINTPGGNAYDGFALVDTMDMSRLQIQTVAVGHVCSMGAIIFIAGTKGKRIMTRNSYMMLHQFSDYGEGKYHEFVAHREHQDDLHDRFVKHVIERTKLKEKQVRDIFLGKDDKWITAKDALKMGLCDAIKNPWE
mgnify:CR=1 FL=1